MNDSIADASAYAKKYLEDLLSFFGLNVEVETSSEDGEVIELNVPTGNLNSLLIGQRGDTMRSLQFVVASSLKNNDYAYNRVNVDIAGYKQQRALHLVEEAQAWIATVKSSGEPMDLKPMNAADRRTMHKAAGDAGITTESVGEGRERHIVLKP